MHVHHYINHTQTLLTFCVSIHHSNWVSFFSHVSLLPDNVLWVILKISSLYMNENMAVFLSPIASITTLPSL